VSFIRPRRSPRNLLITDSGINEAYIYAYPSLKRLYTLTGFSEPQGACSDGAGHFWITNTGDSNIVEYSSDGVNLGTLSDPHNYPVGCAYDPRTGNLAVTNVPSTSDSAGSVAIYAKAQGAPSLYGDPSMQRMYFASYAGSTGTLVVDGENSSYSLALVSFANGTFTNITPKEGQSRFPGGVGWSTRLGITYVGNQGSGDVIYVALSGHVRGQTILCATGCSILSFAIFGGTMAATSAGGAAVYLFDYPGGGRPLPKRIINGFSEPIGVAMSDAVTE
jgi:hypothetical protein